MDWQFAPFGRSDFASFSVLPDKPTLLDQMVEIANILSKDIPFARIDLYQIGNQIYFSEITLHPCGGWMPFSPKEWDYYLGEMIKI